MSLHRRIARRVALTVGAVGLIGAPALAAMLTGEQLASRCADPGSLSLVYCLGYLGGVHDTLKSASRSRIVASGAALNAKRVAPGLCVPKEASIDDIRTAFLAWSREQHESLGVPADQAVLTAITRTWPCPD